MNDHDIVVIAIYAPWRWLLLVVAILGALVALHVEWRRRAAALRIARFVDQAAGIAERGGEHDVAAEFRRQAQQWRRHTWPCRDRTKAAPPAAEEDAP